MQAEILHQDILKIMAQRNAWMRISTLMAMSTILLSTALFFKNERTILVPPHITKTLWVEGGIVSKEYLEEMGLYISKLLLDLSPTSFPYNHGTLLKYATSEAYGALKKQLMEDGEHYAKLQLSTHFKPTEVKANPSKFFVEVKGNLTSYVAGKEIHSSLETLSLQFTLRGAGLLLEKVTGGLSLMINKSLVLLLAGTTVQAAIVRPLDEMKVIEIPISQQGLTRIKVQSDRILHVFGNAGEYVLETDEDQGQVFIRPTLLNDSSAKAISLTLTTEAGHTQDLCLTPKNQAPEALILKVDTEATSKVEKEKRASAPIFREEVEALIFALQEDRIPLGYKEMPINLTTLHEPYTLLRELQGKTLRGLTYLIQNKTQENLVLSESELAKKISLQQNTLIAILISKKVLTPGEGTEAYVVVQAN